MRSGKTSQRQHIEGNPVSVAAIRTVADFGNNIPGRGGSGNWTGAASEGQWQDASTGRDGLSDSSRNLFETLVFEHQDYLFTFIYSMVGNRDDADDLTAKTFLRAYMAFSGFKRNCSFKTWLTTVAINLVKNYRRDTKLLASLDFESEETGYEPPSQSETPEQSALACEQRERIGKLVRQIPIQYRACLVLRHVNQLSYEEISDLTRLPVTTVRNRIHNGKRILRELCEKNGMSVPKEGDDD